jgi:hypothetical protein
LGTCAAGLVIGAGAYLTISRGAKPAPDPNPTPEPVAEKPRPREPIDTPKPSEPKPEPKPDPTPAPDENRDGIPSPTKLDGLRFYLPFDSLTNSRTVEAVSGKKVGPLVGAELIQGQRGKAVRVNVPGYPKPAALPLDDQVGAFRIPAEAPFTFCLWVRLVGVEGGLSPALNLFHAEKKPAPGSQDELKLGISLEEYGGRFSSSNSPDGRTTGHGRSGANTPFKTPPMGEWFHLALIRSEKGRVNALVNGRVQVYSLRYPFALDFESLVMFRASGPATVEVDELCLFDRALTTDELARLGGRPPGDNPPPDTAPSAPPPPKPVAIATPHPVPAATAFSGLQFNLDCESTTNGTVTEAVSGKQVGKGVGLEVTDGARGKALRLPHHHGKDANWCALDLSDQKDQLKVPADKPFALAFWGRRVISHANQFGMGLIDFRTAPKAPHGRALHVGLFASTPATGSVTLADRPVRPTPVKSASGGFVMQEPSKWTHLALVRDEKGEVRLWVNGAESKNRYGTFPAELRYDVLGLVASVGGSKAVIDIDEFCLFDRALTDDEIKKLAGQIK